MNTTFDVRKIGIAVPLGLGVLMLLIFFAGGLSSYTVLGFAVVFLFVAACVFFELQPGQILIVSGVPLVVIGITLATTYEQTTTYSFDGTAPETSTEMTGLSAGIPLVVVGVVLLGAGYGLTKFSVRWPENMGAKLQQLAGSAADSVARSAAPSQAPVGDVVGEVTAPVPPEHVHAAALEAIAALSGGGILLFEERPGLIRAGRGVPGMTPDFAVHVEVTGLPTGSRARIVVALTQPSPAPGPGVLGGDQLDALLARLRSALDTVSPAAHWT